MTAFSFLRKAGTQAGVLLLLALVPSLAVVFFHPHGPTLQGGANEVEMAEVLSWQEPVLWVDAREREEFEASAIPGAVRLTEKEWEELIDGFLDRWEPEARVVIYCGGGDCNASKAVAQRLAEEAGLAELYVLKGGIASWQRAQ